MPQKGEGYVLDKEKTNCTKGASVEFNENDWSVKVLNMTETRTKCTLYFEKEPPKATDVILAKGETEELAYDETVDNNLRYIGCLLYTSNMVVKKRLKNYKKKTKV